MLIKIETKNWGDQVTRHLTKEKTHEVEKVGAIEIEDKEINTKIIIENAKFFEENNGDPI